MANNKTKKEPKKIIVDHIEMPDLQKNQNTMDEQLLKSLGRSSNLTTLIDEMQTVIKKRKKAPRLAFESDPTLKNSNAGVYETKLSLTPDKVIKDLRAKHHLTATILRARGNVLSMMSHLRKDRFDIGIEVNIKPELKDYITNEQLIKLNTRIDNFKNLLMNCGHSSGFPVSKKMTLPTFMDLQTRNGLSFGRHGTEIVTDEFGRFSYFRPVDISTIFKPLRKDTKTDGIREGSVKELERESGELILDKDKTETPDEVVWVQAINGVPKQTFSEKEMLVYTMFPSTDIEHNGYPVTPIDSVMVSITSHMNIEQYNNLYFQNGRSSKGFLVIKSSELDQASIDLVKQSYYASINNVQNSFRAPIFAIDVEDDVEWVATTPQSRDIEFQFLYDQTTRNILSAFGMSPDELPGFNHLSKGTNQSSLSESNNEYKLTAARDIGIKPLILAQQDFLNEYLFPAMDPELSKLCDIVIAGFDAESREQESNNLQMNMPIHYDYDTVLEEVNKQPVGKAMGGSIPFNERYRQGLDSFAEVSNIIGEFCEMPSARLDLKNNYRRDAMYFQHLALLAEANPIAYKAIFAHKKRNMRVFKMLIKDMLDELDN